MDRRSFLTKATLGGATAAAASTLAAPLYAQGKRTLTLVTTWAAALPVFMMRPSAVPT